jgi:hypothetical protein
MTLRARMEKVAAYLRRKGATSSDFRIDSSKVVSAPWGTRKRRKIYRDCKHRTVRSCDRKSSVRGAEREQATAQECSTKKKCAECGNRKICLERILILEIDGILPDEGPHTCSQIIGIFFYRVCCSLIPTNQIPKSFEPCKEHGHARSNAGHTISNKETQKERPKVLFG